MKTLLKQADPLAWSGEALVFGVWAGKEPSGRCARLDEVTGGALTDAWGGEGFTGKSGEALLFRRPAGVEVRRLVVVGLGDPGESGRETWFRLGGTAARRLLKEGAAEVAIFLPEDGSAPEGINACVEGFLLGGGGIGAYKTGEKSRRHKDVYSGPYRRMTLLTDIRPTAAHRRALTRAEATAEGVLLARRLVNTPGNRMRPRDLAAEARRAGRQSGLTVTVWSRRQLEEKGFAGLLAVSRGSDEPPRFVVMRYRPERPGQAARAPLLLVGKGITFDSGGISIKPSKGMEEMKADMAGAAAVIGAMSAIGRLKPPRPVIGVVPTCENMPSGSATRPGDVIETYGGKTIEVLNTDAEGRLILADGLAWAAEQRPEAIVDIATLTGACVVALGHVYAGLMGNDDAWIETVRSSAGEAGEKLWPLPMDREYDALVDSDIADVRNTGKDQPGAITAAKLLERFVGENRWAHLDIAGVEWRKEPASWTGTGPTGFGVRTFVNLALRERYD